ncbi:unnamed protein product, partial [marine sediment metagenome]
MDLSDEYENISYNNFWNNESGDYNNLPDQTGLNGNISIDPLFVSSGDDEYHLRSTSPCIDGGDPGFVGLV